MPKVLPEYKEEAKRRIVQHAMKMFSEKGYYGTKMIDIAKSMGVSKGALYQYFQSKQEILLAVLEANAARRGQEVQSFLETGGLPILATDEFFERMLNLRMGTPVFNFDLYREAMTNKTMMKILKTNVKIWVEGLCNLIRSFQKKGVVRETIDPDSLARGLLALRDGLYSSLSFGLDVSEAKKTWVDIMNLLLKETLVSSPDDSSS